MKKRTIESLAKVHIHTDEDIRNYIPRKYIDCSNPKPIKTAKDGEMFCLIGRVWNIDESKKNKMTILKCDLIDENQDKVTISFFGMTYIKPHLKRMAAEQTDVICCGKISLFMGKWYISNPPIFSENIVGDKKVHPVYRKIKGVSEDMLNSIRNNVLYSGYKDVIPKEILNSYPIWDEQTAFFKIHHPYNMQDVMEAKRRINLNKLLYFTAQLEASATKLNSDTEIILNSIDKASECTKNLEFTLTPSQKDTLNKLVGLARAGKRINALIQGDVGSGKTIIAVLMLIAFAENDYQGVLMAPTTVLAEQHYKELLSRLSPLGFRIIYLHSKMTKSERSQAIKHIQSGDANIIVGTHSVFSKDIEYNNLGLVITDEEHKFGVVQKEALKERGDNGIHIISMSATPIPRTIATNIIGKSMQIFNIAKPSERIDVKTRIFNKEKGIFQFIKNEIEKGNQAYVICPLIEENESLEGVQDTNSTYKKYCEYFGSNNVACITGKTPIEEMTRIINSFKVGETKILVATSVIEVGVNVPKANTIVINNPERFGLASLHQLRGRVGRGNEQAYCILNSSESDNHRLLIMEQTCNGFEIAEADYRQRGSGNILGVEQSGHNEYVELLLSYPELYEMAKSIYTDMKTIGIDGLIIDEYCCRNNKLFVAENNN